MSFPFDRFPYTNLHTLNLDWVLQIVSKLKDEFPTIAEDLNKKLNKPVFNPNGADGDILFSNGDGTTRWEAFSASIGEEIAEAVDEWLTEHPEATTTVQDGAISPAKLNTELYNLYKAAGDVQIFVPAITEPITGAAGNSTLMVTPTKTILFDCQSNNHKQEAIDYFTTLYNAGVFTNIDVIIISHYHWDHVEGLEDILTAFPHNNCRMYMPISPSGYYAAVADPTLINYYNEVVRVAAEFSIETITINEDTKIDMDHLVSVEFFNSNPTAYEYYSNNQSGYNNYSMVSLVKIGNHYAMFPGDLETAGQEYTMTVRDLPRVSFYLVEHHGVDRATYLPYIMKLNPLYAVVPNSYTVARGTSQYGQTAKLIKGFIGQAGYDSYSFAFDSSGASITHGIECIHTGEYIGNTIELIVDNSYDGDYHFGTFEHPFTTITEALNFVNDERTLDYLIRVVSTGTAYTGMLVRDIRNNIQIRAYDSAYPPEITYVQVKNCSKVTFTYLKFKGDGVSNVPSSGNSASITLDNAKVVFSGCEFDGSSNTGNAYLCVSSLAFIRLNSCNIHDYYQGFTTYSPSTKSEIETSGTTFNNFASHLFNTQSIEVNIFDNNVITNITGNILQGADRTFPAVINRNLLTAAFAAKCSASAFSKPCYGGSTHPIIMLSNSKVYDLLTGDPLT